MGRRSKWVRARPSESEWVMRPREYELIQVNPCESSLDPVSPSKTKWEPFTSLRILLSNFCWFDRCHLQTLVKSSEANHNNNNNDIICRPSCQTPIVSFGSNQINLQYSLILLENEIYKQMKCSKEQLFSEGVPAHVFLSCIYDGTSLSKLVLPDGTDCYVRQGDRPFKGPY